MGKRAAKPNPPAPKARRIWAITSATVSLLIISGPLALHFLIGLSLSPILTSSMAPYAQPGDLLISLPTKASTLNIGDVISLHNTDTGSYYAHRIIEVREQGEYLRLITKGDANPTAELDPFIVAPDDTVHKEVLKVKWIGAPLVFINSDQGRAASISLLAIANFGMIAYFFQKRKKADGSKSDQA